MRLIFFVATIDPTDPTRGFLYRWLLELAKKVEHLYVFAGKGEEVDLPENCTMVHIGRDRDQQQSAIHAAKNFHRAIWPLLRQGKVDAILTHMYPKFAIVAAPYARIFGLRLGMWHTHTRVDTELKTAGKLVHMIFTASPQSCQLKSSKVKRVGHGIDTSVFQPPCDPTFRDPMRLIAIGRLSHSKHHEVLIRAVDLLIKRDATRFGKLRLDLIGPTYGSAQEAYRDEMISLIASLGMERQIRYSGALPYTDIITTYQNASLILSGSQTGLDKVVLEAMACGTIPLVSFQDFDETFEELSDQLIYEHTNVESLADLICETMSLNESDLTDLRTQVCRKVEDHHELPQLIGRIFDHLKTP